MINFFAYFCCDMFRMGSLLIGLSSFNFSIFPITIVPDNVTELTIALEALLVA